MMIVRLYGGLGNQLFQYAVGKQLSVRNGIPLKLDLSCMHQPGVRKYRLNYFQVSDPFASQEEVDSFFKVYDSRSLYARVYRKFQSMLPKRKQRYFLESDYWAYEPELMRITSPVFLEGFWQHYKYFATLAPQVLESLQLKPEYKQAAAPVLKEIQQNEQSVSLHMRRGDYVSDPYNLSFFGVMPLAYYTQAVELMKHQVKSPTFYIFSDDLQWARDHLKLKAPMVLVDIDGGKKDYLELDAMQQCRHNIIANSTFSWWGAFLNQNPSKQVVAPAQWVAEEGLNKRVQIQLPSWTTI